MAMFSHSFSWGWGDPEASEPCASWVRGQMWRGHSFTVQHKLDSHLRGSPTVILQPTWPDPRTAEGKKKRKVRSRPWQGFPMHKLSAQDLTGSNLFLEAGRVETVPRSPSKLGPELG